MDWASILIQLPIVAAFIWFVLEMDKRQKDYNEKREESWQEYLTNERKASEAALGKVASNLDELSENIRKHDQKLDMAIAVMKERTSQKKV